MVKFKKITNEVKAKPEEEIKIDSFYENPRILLIAPHGVEDKPFDDIGTAALVMGLADRLHCHRILNTEYRRPEGKQPEKRNNGVADKNKKVLNLNIRYLMLRRSLTSSTA